jgi:hypothetical protein
MVKKMADQLYGSRQKKNKKKNFIAMVDLMDRVQFGKTVTDIQ